MRKWTKTIILKPSNKSHTYLKLVFFPRDLFSQCQKRSLQRIVCVDRAVLSCNYILFKTILFMVVFEQSRNGIKCHSKEECNMVFGIDEYSAFQY